MLNGNLNCYIFLFFLIYKLYVFSLLLAAREEPTQNPCEPSPCGPYSNCRVVNNHAVCSCKENYIGNPPSCKPECMVSSDCLPNLACLNQRCKDPCPGACGINAKCQVVNHNPICSCNSGYTGDPFIRCLLEESESHGHNIKTSQCIIFYT